MEPSNVNLIKYRISRAEEALEAAILLIDANHFNAGINRLYFSMLDILRALIHPEFKNLRKHQKLKDRFKLIYLDNQLLDQKYLFLISELEKTRTASDYQDYFYPTEVDFTFLISETKELLQDVKRLTKLS